MPISRMRAAAPPLAQSFVVCREIIEDCRSHEFVLIGPFTAIIAPQFPLAARLSVYAHLTCGHGEYDMALQLWDTEDRALWQWQSPTPIRLSSPLDQHRFSLYDAVLKFPAAGRYDLQLLANGQEVARHALHIMRAPGQD